MSIVEYHRMRPAQVVARRERLPVAYMGIGILEWHGLHNPMGLDGVKANGIACYLAERIGGIVMPPQFWGDDRSDIAELAIDPNYSPWLPPHVKDQTHDICRLMKLDKEKFQKDGERSMLFPPAQEAITTYNASGGTCKVLMLTDRMYSDTGKAGDHAAAFETSLIMALYPELVDMDQLGADLSAMPVGVLGEDPRIHASREFGLDILRKFEEIVRAFVNQ